LSESSAHHGLGDFSSIRFLGVADIVGDNGDVHFHSLSRERRARSLGVTPSSDGGGGADSRGRTIVELDGGLGGGLFELENANIVVDGAGIVVGVHLHGRDGNALSLGSLGKILPVDQNINVSGGDGIAAMGSSQNTVGRDQRSSAELSVKRGLSLLDEGDEEGVLESRRDNLASNNVPGIHGLEVRTVGSHVERKSQG